MNPKHLCRCFFSSCSSSLVVSNFGTTMVIFSLACLKKRLLYDWVHYLHASPVEKATLVRDTLHILNPMLFETGKKCHLQLSCSRCRLLDLKLSELLDAFLCLHWERSSGLCRRLCVIILWLHCAHMISFGKHLVFWSWIIYFQSMMKRPFNDYFMGLSFLRNVHFPSLIVGHLCKIMLILYSEVDDMNNDWLEEM